MEEMYILVAQLGLASSDCVCLDVLLRKVTLGADMMTDCSVKFWLCTLSSFIQLLMFIGVGTMHCQAWRDLHSVHANISTVKIENN